MAEQYTAIDLVKRIKSKSISPVEVMNHYMNEIDKHNDQVNAFVTMNPHSMEEAKQAEQDVQQGKQLGPLHGVPVGIKDLTPTKGIKTSFGTKVFADHVPDRDATIVKRLKAAGAIIMGKTNTPDFGHKGTTDNLLFGATKNPWNLEKTAGGSSGGSAAAVAAGMVPFAEGSDGGGSIRIPASFCGVYGFKPSYGRIPMDNSLANAFGSNNPFVNHGSLSRTVRDAALFVDVTQGPSTTDPFSLPRFDEELLEQLEGSLQGVKIAYTKDFGMYTVDKEVLHIVDQQVERLRELGAEVEEISMDFDMTLHQFLGFFKNTWYASASAGGSAMLRDYPELLTPSYHTMIERGYDVSTSEYIGYQQKRTAVWRELQRHFERFDLIMSPSLSVPAFDYQLLGPEEIEGKKIEADSDWMMTHIYNMTGLPAASIPAGFTKSGLPIGMQLAGNRFNDGLVLRASLAYEKLIEGFPVIK
ncbi:glutamyl-tRNA amidotransferase [Virgibacillus phasianinus]|uniref:Glutamyl-tRNA amidotransferase n=1 Tax=Virgibacillus phasianinus TaxID=2017483 RepID=A0A220U1L5_9BACI|nr:amidase [Virgibacillus phasianinus]ASK61967.1 glutamyl-tRNA amidotransferase [Virgibacillus phasianinus]